MWSTLRTKLFLVLFATLLLQCTQDPLVFEMPPFTVTTLKNGLKLYLFEDHKLPTISMSFLFKVGSASDPGDKKGLAGLTATLLEEGTKTKNALHIADELEILGAQFNAEASHDYTSISSQALSKDTHTLLQLISDILLNPTFPENELQRRKKELTSSLIQQKDKPDQLTDFLHVQHLYKGHPYSPAKIATLNKIERKDILDFYSRYFVPNNATLAVVGDFNSKDLLKALAEHFSQWQSQEIKSVQLKNPTRIEKNEIYVVHKPQTTQTQVRLGNIAINRGDKDYYAVVVANHLFGGSYNSILTQRVRDDLGLTYHIHSAVGLNQFKSGWSVETFTRNEMLNDTLKEILNIIKDFDKFATEEELNKIKAQLSGMHVQRLETIEAIANILIIYDFYGLSLEKDFKKWRINIENITLADVKRVVKQYWREDSLLVTILTDPSVSLDKLPLQGSIKTIKFEDIEL